MKIAHVFSHFNIGGAQTMLSDIMNVQINYCKVTLFILTDDINEPLIRRLDNRIKIVMMHRKIGGWNYFPYMKLNWQINFNGFDLVHIHEMTIWKYLYIVPWIRKFQTVHNTGLYSNYFNKCERVFSISRSVEQGLLRKGYKNVVLAPNGINPSIIKIKDNYNDNVNNQFKIVQVSRLIIEHKGQDLAIEAFHLLDEEGRLPSNMELEFIGEGKDMDKLKKMVNTYHLGNNIRFVGQRDRDFVYSHLKDYDLFLQPSRYEGFGLTVAEAMAAMIPVLVSRNEGPVEIIDYGRCGYSFENGNIKDLAEKIINIYSNYETAQKKAEVGYKFVKSQYNVNKTAHIYLDYYNVPQ